MKVFLSAVSAELGACRETLASDLRALGCEVREQKDVQQAPATLIERIEALVVLTVAQNDQLVAFASIERRRLRN